MNQFTKDIKQFNEMYGLPSNDVPVIPFKTCTEKGTARRQLLDRLSDFRKIMLDEVQEVTEIMAKVNAGEEPVDILTDLADWLGDMQVYCASEMRKFGLDNEMVLGTIMLSNFSKLGPDGKAIMAEGKVQKGPGYWKPEPKLKRLIQAALVAEASRLDESTSAQQGDQS